MRARFNARGTLKKIKEKRKNQQWSTNIRVLLER
jgi:hypothetical protein